MSTAPDPSVDNSTDLGADLPVSFSTAEINDDGAPLHTHSTRLMLTTAAHFVQEHLHSELAQLGLTPIDLSVLSGLAELSGAATPEVAAQCLLSGDITEHSLAELSQRGFVTLENGVYSMTAAGSRALIEARDLEDALFAEKSTTLRMELGSLISRLRDGGVLNPE